MCNRSAVFDILLKRCEQSFLCAGKSGKLFWDISLFCWVTPSVKLVKFFGGFTFSHYVWASFYLKMNGGKLF